MTLRAIALAAFGLCVASLAYVFTSVDGARAPAPRAQPGTSSAAAAPAPRLSAPRAPIEIRPAAAPWSALDAPSIVAQRWQAAADKRDFYEHALRTGGGAYLHFAGKALAQCGAVNRLGVIGAEQRFGQTHRANDPTLPRRIEAFRASIAGCDVGRSFRHDLRRRQLDRGRAVAVERHGAALQPRLRSAAGRRRP